MAMELVDTLQRILSRSKKEDFIREFNRFCTTVLPRNPGLRQEIGAQILQLDYSTALLPSIWFGTAHVVAPLPEEWETTVSEALNNEIITHIKIPLVANSSLHRLRHGEFLNDEIIEGYSKLLRLTTGAKVCDSFMITETAHMRRSINSEVDYQYIEKHGQVLIPLHHPKEEHWTFVRLTCSHAQSKHVVRVEHLDSIFGNKNLSGLKLLHLWFEERLPGVVIDLIQCRGPQQENCYDCGLFALMGMRLMSMGSEHLSQQEASELMPKFRAKVLAELLANKIDPDSDDHEAFVERNKRAMKEISPIDCRVLQSSTGEEGDPLYLYTPSPRSSDEKAQSDLFVTKVQDSSFQVFNEIEEESATLPLFEGIQTPPKVNDVDLVDIGSLNEGHLGMMDDKPESGSAVPIIVTDDAKPVGENRSTTPNSVSILSPDRPRNRKPQEPSAPKTTKRKRYQIDEMALGFADPTRMITSLKAAVQLCRTKRNLPGGERTLALLWAAVGNDENPQSAFFHRHDRHMFSRQFYSEKERLGGKTRRITPNVRSSLMEMLGSDDVAVYKTAQSQASRSSIWTELVDCVVNTLEIEVADANVVLCACHEATTTVEQLRTDERAILIQGMKKRLMDKDDCLRGNLLAAKGLYRSIMNGSLPDHALSIEGKVDLNLTTFEEIVGLEVAPTKLALRR